MKSVNRLLGRKHSEQRKQRHRDNMRRLVAEGRRFGSPLDPRTRFEVRKCKLPSCSKEFVFKIRPKTDAVKHGHYCCQTHAINHVSILRIKAPDDFELLFDLYVTKDMTTTEIGQMFNTTHGAVRHRLKYLGIVRRKVGASRHWVCVEKDCNEPVFKLKHPNNGSWYGTRCEQHRKEHRDRLSKSYQDRKRAERGNITQKICRMLATGTLTSREMAERLEVPVRVVSNTMGHLRTDGRAVAVGSIQHGKAKHILYRLAEVKKAA